MEITKSDSSCGISYDINRPWNSLDVWQEEYINEKGNCFLLCGRQVGKTTAASIKFGRRAAENDNQVILMIAFTERQAYNLFFKTLLYLQACHPALIKKGTHKPTQHVINLKNGSKIMCYAAGTTGLGLKGYTCTSVVVDEAAAMNREIFIMISPMISVTGGTMDLLSTPRGKEGYFYECSLRDDFRKFYASAEDCPRHKKEFLESEKKSMSLLEYAQEYLAVFLDELKRVFNETWIKRVCVLKRPIAKPIGNFYLGCDIAAMGEDVGTYQIIQKIDKEHLIQVDSIITRKQRINDTVNKILELEREWEFSKIYVDDGGIGAGVFDYLLVHDDTKRKVVAINNRARPLDRDEKSKKKMLKEDLYANLLRLGERREIQLLDDDEVIASLAGVQYEYIVKEGQKSRLRISGREDHIAEGIVRAAFCVNDRGNVIWIR